MGSFSQEAVREALSHVVEPDLKKDVITLDLVENLKIEGAKISFTLKISNPAMHSRKRMYEACEFTLKRFLGDEIEVDIEIEGLPKKNENPELRKILPGVKNIVAVASGKGGVGKSTVTSNLAVGLAKKGYKVGLIDADIYGPSVPTMFDVKDQRPQLVEVNGKKLIQPIENHGVKMLSIGFFAEANQAVVWRGPMASKALDQMFSDVYWGELDYVLIDLPPGTGDIHLTLVQSLPLNGAVIVSTPQEVALADARKGVNMFQIDTINVPVLGIVENMAWFTPEELPDNKYHIFGKNGAKDLAERMKVPFLGHLPLIQSVREAGDVGRPAMLQENTLASQYFDELVNNFEDELNKAVEAKVKEKAAP